MEERSAESLNQIQIMLKIVQYAAFGKKFFQLRQTDCSWVDYRQIPQHGAIQGFEFP